MYILSLFSQCICSIWHLFGCCCCLFSRCVTFELILLLRFRFVAFNLNSLLGVAIPAPGVCSLFRPFMTAVRAVCVCVTLWRPINKGPSVTPHAYLLDCNQLLATKWATGGQRVVPLLPFASIPIPISIPLRIPIPIPNPIPIPGCPDYVGVGKSISLSAPRLQSVNQIGERLAAGCPRPFQL